MELLTPDYAVLAVTLTGAVIGLFIGFSGALAFLLGTISAGATASFVWPRLAGAVASVGVRTVVVGVSALLVFGLVRWIVRKCVHGLMAQPGDAIFGSLLTAIATAAASLVLVWALGFLTGNASFDSAFLHHVAEFLP